MPSDRIDPLFNCSECGHPITAHQSAVDRRPGPCAVCGCRAIEPLFYSAPVCDDCWREREGERVPIRLNGVRKEVCHYCGRETTSGIYQRARRSVFTPSERFNDLAHRAVTEPDAPLCDFAWETAGQPHGCCLPPGHDDEHWCSCEEVHAR